MKDVNGKEFSDDCLVRVDGISELLNCKKLHSGEICLLSKGLENNNLKLTEEIIKKGNITIVDSIRINANQELFYKLHEISNRIKTLSGIIQNDMIVTKEELVEWNKVYDLNLQDLQEWHKSVSKLLNI